MASSDEWEDVVQRIRTENRGWASPSVGRLYTIALVDGRSIIGSFRAQFGEDRLIDLIQDLLAERLLAIVASENPKAFFRTALIRRAISWRRRGDASVAEEPTSIGPAHDAEIDERERPAFIVDARAIVESLGERDREVAVAVALGEDRDELAARFKTSRANIDQIVSRVRARLKGPNK